jgi:uncharacterized protein (UPF0261 family)
LGGPFWDPPANRALFDVIASNFRAATNRKLLRIPHHINDPEFADALVASFLQMRTSDGGAPAPRRPTARHSHEI